MPRDGLRLGSVSTAWDRTVVLPLSGSVRRVAGPSAGKWRHARRFEMVIGGGALALIIIVLLLILIL